MQMVLRQSLATDQDEESILSHSYLDCHLDHHSNTMDSSTTWGRHTVCTAQKGNRNHADQSERTRTEMATSLVTRTVTEYCDRGHVINPKRVITDMVPDRPHRCSP